jgi:hypothetical protein
VATDPELRLHQEWMGYLQPVGLVVSAPALVAAQAFVNRNVAREQQALAALVAPVRVPSPDAGTIEAQSLTDFAAFTREVLDWQPADLQGSAGQSSLPDELTVALPEYGDTLKPTFAVPDPDRPGQYTLLVEIVPVGTDLDRDPHAEGRRWQASPQMRFERLLRETGVPVGLLSNGTHLRLVYRPSGESSGYVTFPIAPMLEPAGRPILGALAMLLGAERLFTLPPNQRLLHILKESRKYQNEVSTALAEQVLGALHDLLRGFQAADDATSGRLLGDVLREAPSDVYGGLLTVLLRLVFVLYAEDRGLIGGDPVYQASYALTGLFTELREDVARFPDTMEQRQGAWARLLVLFRLVHDGAAHGTFRMPARYGKLFDPDVYPFLEGRAHKSLRQLGARIEVPKVSDGVVYRVLDSLLVLAGERLSYRALDVEQIGSVYEAMMGFAIERAVGPSIAVKPQHVVVDLGALVKKSAAERVKTLAEEAGCKLPTAQAERVKAAKTVDELVAALDKRVSPRTPRVIVAGGMFLQPGEERRRSGSHYTPRSLTEPIVRTTLRPVLEALGAAPKPEAVLGLKVCDPAMGSGAFLVEACRALGDVLVASWQAHGLPADLPDNEDPVLHARRLVAQRCLYGVDKNPFAVDLARLSLWLVTLAKDHPFTFLDHALRQGDSLVGLSREQISCLHWEVGKQLPLVRAVVEKAVKEAEARRGEIHARAMADDVGEKRRLLDEAERAIGDARVLGDCVVAAFFDEEKDAGRKKRVKALGETVKLWLQGAIVNEVEGERGEQEKADPKGELEGIARGLRERARPVTPFHWELEFPEVFSRENGGFDAIVGNPPFAGKNAVYSALGERYAYFLVDTFAEAHGSSDLVAFFFRRSFAMLRREGSMGLIATNTIAQGDTRHTGLRWICQNGGFIAEAHRRIKWHGAAAVTVSVVYILKTVNQTTALLDGRPVDRVTAFLFHLGGNDDPVRMRENKDRSFVGSVVFGAGFLFDDDNNRSSSISEMQRLLLKDPRNQLCISPYIGGEEINNSPSFKPRRYVIGFGHMSREEAANWPDLLAIVEAKVKPERDLLGDVSDAKRRKANWWHWGQYSVALFESLRSINRVLVTARTSKYLAISTVPSSVVFSENVVVFALQRAALSVLQSRIHEIWVKLTASTLEDRQGYRPTDCFETFPFPSGVLGTTRGDTPTDLLTSVLCLEEVGLRYDEYRAKLMVDHNEGLTTTYNRFHDPEERDASIVRLRELHAEMDRAVLDAYGWTDIAPRCEFLLDYEEAGDEEEETGKRRKKKPWRYRWPDEVRDEVLARLIALNGERAAEERRAGEAAVKAAGAGEKPKRAKKAKGEAEGTGGLFG